MVFSIAGAMMKMLCMCMCLFVSLATFLTSRNAIISICRGFFFLLVDWYRFMEIRSLKNVSKWRGEGFSTTQGIKGFAVL